MASLQASETDRALVLWQRKFGTPPSDLRDRARQVRFLTSRGFSGDVIRQVLRAAAAQAVGEAEAQ